MTEHEENQVTISRRAPGAPFASAARAQICAALAAAQGKFQAPKRSKTATIKPRDGGQGYSFNFAPLEEVIAAVKQGLAENGLSRQQYLIRGDGSSYFVRTIIWHASGEWLASDYPVITTKDTPQGFAAGVTYARRYGLSLALGLAPEDDGDSNEGNTVDIKPSNGPPDALVEARGQLPNGEQYDCETGEISDDHQHETGEAMMWRYDAMLSEASERGTAALMEAWVAIPRGGLQQQLKAALERRHKSRALEVDKVRQ